MAHWIDQFDRRLDLHPPLDDEQLARVPAKRGAVLLLAERDEPIVLITGADIRARLRTRLRPPQDDAPRKTADLRRVTRAVAWKLADSHFETDLRFFELARAIWPSRYTSLLGWKPAWFVHADPSADFPHFAATRRVFADAGRYVGPFPGERAANRFIAALQDAFDLCRDLRCLRRAPNAEPCAYGQMRRCLLPCDGTISMDEYRRVVARAADFAAGRRAGLREGLESQMKAAAERLDFERAAAAKARLKRLDELDSPELARARPAEAFRFVLVQRGGARQAKVFLADRGRVAEAAPLAYPLERGELGSRLSAMARLVADGGEVGEAERWRMGLVARYLFSSTSRRGVIVRWGVGLSAAALEAAIEGGRKALGLRQPRRKGSGGGAAG
jgi:excinuclease ABC subunit C